MIRNDRFLTLILAPSLLAVIGCSSLQSMSPLTRSGDIKAQQNLARIQERQGKLGQAKEIYNKVLKVDRKNADAHHRLAVIAAKQGDMKEAEAHFKQAAEAAPKNLDIKIDYAYLMYTTERYTESEALLYEALRQEPDNKRALNNLALAAGRQQKYEQALALFRKSVGDAQACANVAFMYSQTGDLDMAEKYYSRALTLDSSIKPAAHALVQIGQLKKQKAAMIAAREAQDSQSQPSETAAAAVPEREPSVSAKSKTLPAVRQVRAEATRDSAAPSPVTHADRKVPTFEADRPTEQPADIEQISASTTNPETALIAPTREAPQDLISVSAQEQEAEAVAEASLPDMLALCPEASGEQVDLVRELGNADSSARKAAISKLSRMGTAALPSAPACRAALEDPNVYVRTHAALAVWRIEHDAGAALPVLTRSLRDSQPAVRSLSAAALAEMGSAASGALPALKGSLVDRDASVRVYVAEACCQINPKERTALQVLIRSLKHQDAAVREMAAYALGNVRPEENEACIGLALAAQDREARVRAAAIFALGEIGPAASVATKELELGLQDSDEDVRIAAEMALARVQGQDAAPAATSSPNDPFLESGSPSL